MKSHVGKTELLGLSWLRGIMALSNWLRPTDKKSQGSLERDILPPEQRPNDKMFGEGEAYLRHLFCWLLSNWQPQNEQQCVPNPALAPVLCWVYALRVLLCCWARGRMRNPSSSIMANRCKRSLFTQILSTGFFFTVTAARKGWHLLITSFQQGRSVFFTVVMAGLWYRRPWHSGGCQQRCSNQGYKQQLQNLLWINNQIFKIWFPIFLKERKYKY